MFFFACDCVGVVGGTHMQAAWLWYGSFMPTPTVHHHQQNNKKVRAKALCVAEALIVSSSGGTASASGGVRLPIEYKEFFVDNAGELEALVAPEGGESKVGGWVGGVWRWVGWVAGLSLTLPYPLLAHICIYTPTHQFHRTGGRP